MSQNDAIQKYILNQLLMIKHRLLRTKKYKLQAMDINIFTNVKRKIRQEKIIKEKTVISVSL